MQGGGAGALSPASRRQPVGRGGRCKVSAVKSLSSAPDYNVPSVMLEEERAQHCNRGKWHI